MEITTSFNDIIYQTQYLEASGLKFSSLGDMATFIFYISTMILIISNTILKFLLSDFSNKIHVDSKKVFIDAVFISIIDLITIGLSFFIIFDVIMNRLSFDEFFFRIIMNLLLAEVFLIILYNVVLGKPFSLWDELYIIGQKIIIYFYCFSFTYIIILVYSSFLDIFILAGFYIYVLVNTLKNRNFNTVTNHTVIRFLQNINIIIIVINLIKISEEKYIIIFLALISHIFALLIFVYKIEEEKLVNYTYNVYIDPSSKDKGNSTFFTEKITDNKGFLYLYDYCDTKGGDKKKMIMLNKNIVSKIEIENIKTD